MVPEGFALAPVGHVMQQQEVADMHVFAVHVAIVGRDQRGIEAAIGKQVQQPVQPGVDQVDAGRLQRLQETGRQAPGHAVLDPLPPTAARREPQCARLRQGGAVQAV